MNVSQIVTERILEKLDKGVIPWRMPWGIARPKNYISGKEYRGVNRLLLSGEYECEYWITFLQTQELGGSIKKGAKSSPVIFYKTYKEELDGKEKTNCVMRYYSVFNLSDTTIDVPLKAEPIKHNINDYSVPEGIVGKYLTENNIRLKTSDRAFYRDSEDVIGIPKMESFENLDEYFSTMFHEIIHSTAKETRCNRKLTYNRYDSAYGFEELIAEIGSAYLCQETMINFKAFDNQVSYINDWKETISANSNIIISASREAEKGYNFVLGKTEYVESKEIA